MEQCKDRTKTPSKPKRTKLESIDHYAGIAIIILFGGLLAGFTYLILHNHNWSL